MSYIHDLYKKYFVQSHEAAVDAVYEDGFKHGHKAGYEEAKNEFSAASSSEGLIEDAKNVASTVLEKAEDAVSTVTDAIVGSDTPAPNDEQTAVEALVATVTDIPEIAATTSTEQP